MRNLQVGRESYVLAAVACLLATKCGASLFSESPSFLPADSGIIRFPEIRLPAQGSTPFQFSYIRRTRPTTARSGRHGEYVFVRVSSARRR